jgi:hypothetical protein
VCAGAVPRLPEREEPKNAAAGVDGASYDVQRRAAVRDDRSEVTRRDEEVQDDERGDEQSSVGRAVIHTDTGPVRLQVAVQSKTITCTVRRNARDQTLSERRIVDPDHVPAEVREHIRRTELRKPQQLRTLPFV